MSRETVNEIRDLLDEIRGELAELSGRVARLEAAPETAAPVTPPAREGVSEDTLLAISAAVAAFLGERVRIRQVRLVPSTAWAQEGRVSIQASHRLQH